MRREGLVPNAVTFLCILKACGNIGSSTKGEELHLQITREKLLEGNILLATALIDMYGKCDEVMKAQEVFDELEGRDVVSWTALIAGYAQHGQGAKALCCYEQMHHEGYLPNSVTFLGVLKACGCIGATERGQTIHAKIVKERLVEKDLSVGNALIDMYAKCGELRRAHLVFDKLPIRNTVSWTSLIGGYAEHGYSKEALNCLESMNHEGFSPDVITFVCALRACGDIGATEKGREIHKEIDRGGFLETDILVGNTLVDMYAKCDALVEAQEVFDKLPVQDIVAWTVIIAAYSQNGHGQEALNCFGRMQSKGISPNKVTYLSVLKACGSVGALDKGKEIHGEIEKDECLKKDVLIGNALVDMYSQCGEFARAQRVFDELPIKNIVSWTALIAGYAQHERGEEALNCFEHLQQAGLSPDAVTFVFLLKACSSLGAAEKGEEIHAAIVKEGLLKTDILVANALIDMYAKCGVFEKAEAIFDGLLIRTVVSWTSLLAGYAQHGLEEKALEYFDKMRHEGLSPNEVTLLCILKACSSVGAIDRGIEIHSQMVQEGLHEKHGTIGNALVDMYAKCGELERAHAVFCELQVKDVVSWTALIAGYAQLGDDNMVNVLLKGMVESGIVPNLVTFSVILNAYSHSGTLELSQMLFKSVITSYDILPMFEHYTCMVDLFARAGHFDKALLVIKEMPMFDYLPVWTSVLGACQKWGNVDVGRLAFDHAVQWDGKDSALYVCMSNIYALAAQQDPDKFDSVKAQEGMWE
jgi:pentatricopeptide repeat protein